MIPILTGGKRDVNKYPSVTFEHQKSRVSALKRTQKKKDYKVLARRRNDAIKRRAPAQRDSNEYTVRGVVSAAPDRPTPDPPPVLEEPAKMTTFFVTNAPPP